MKVLFLDIDGVLNSYQAIHMFHRMRKMNCKEHGIGCEWHPYEDFCPINISNLIEIIEQLPDLKIVVSSVWRMGHSTPDELRTIFDPIKEIAKPIRDAIIDRTDFLGYGTKRGAEIDKWLKEHPEVTDFVILDDDADMEPHMDKLVQTDVYVGLDWNIAHKIIEILKD